MTNRSLTFSFLFLLIIVFLAACDTVEPAPSLPSDQSPSTVLEVGTDPADMPQTAVADSSPTPIQTPALVLHATPTEEPELVIDPAKMPAITHDLLFVGNGMLKRWQRDGQVVTLLDGDVVDYSLSVDGRRAVVAQLMASTEISDTITAVTRTINTYALNYVNLETGATQRLIPAVNSFNSPAFQLSQDGKHLAVSALSVGDPAALSQDEEVTAELFVMETEVGQAPEKEGECARICHYPLWHQDNNFFVYADDDGLYLKNLAGKEPELLLSGEDGTEYGRHFEPLSWAKNGRWLLLRVSDMNGTDHYVFDVPTKQLMIVPYTNSYDGFPYTDVTWMQDDRLFMVRNEGDPVVGETWLVNMDANELQLDESVILSEEHLRPWTPVHWANGHFGYGLLNNGLVNSMDENTTKLYRHTAFNEPPELINSVPEAAAHLVIEWAPDGSGALVHVGNHVYYAPDGGETVDLTMVAGLTGQNFTWLP